MAYKHLHKSKVKYAIHYLAKHKHNINLKKDETDE